MGNSRLVSNRLVFEELSYDCDVLKQEAEYLSSKLTDEQRVICNTMLEDISCNLGGLFFVYSYGGNGKTFLWRALSSTLRAKRQIVLNVTSSDIASLLLLGGRTAHSRFAIPIAINEDSTLVLGGDFRQILPVVPKGTIQDIVSAAVNSSYMWNNCEVLKLTKNLRLSAAPHEVDKQKLEDFANWIADIGDGKTGGPNDGYVEVEIPKNMPLPSDGNHISTIVKNTFPMFVNGNSNHTFVEGQAILSSILDVVNQVNEYMSALHTSESRTYFSCDNVCKADADNGILGDVHTPELLNGIRVLGLPNHTLTLKIGSPVMLMRNIDHSVGLCNGTRLIITKLADRIIEAEIMTGANRGTKVLIPRMSMSPSDLRLPFKFQRKQFPLMLSYAMTINKSQGQTLSHVGLLLKNRFLYIASCTLLHLGLTIPMV
ncbi:uncharacterized protein LOC116016062 [Ipomoea triloba]|uniref:uncharacterized protein LOC116016062 n=1 Tax=Ipomoea triloba TaxID=35885 RepID=UPI00125D9FEF|nr:uncharacterized protein LOC116016062 [Ipomoea triloba]